MTSTDTAAVEVPSSAGTSGRWGEALVFNEPQTDLALNLSRLRFADPLFLLRLKAYLDWHAARGYEVKVIPPLDQNVARYLSRMQVGQNLPDGIECELPAVRERARADVLIPVTHLRRHLESDQLDAALEGIIQANFPGSLATVGDAFLMGVSEMTDNATTHGRSDFGAYVAAQRYQSKRCVLAIADLGVGIPQHIRSVHPELVEDGDAIARATVERVTAAPDRHTKQRGHGYQHVIDAMITTRVHEGQLRIWSGRGRFELTVVKGEQRLRRGRTIEQSTPGTWVKLELAAR